jgi:hypothetical protein
MSWLGLEEEKEVSIFLGPFIVWEEAFLEIRGILKMTRDFVLLA